MLPPKIGALGADAVGLEKDLELGGPARKIENLRRASDLIAFFVEADRLQWPRVELPSEVDNRMPRRLRQRRDFASVEHAPQQLHSRIRSHIHRVHSGGES